ncbi:MAG TPA: DUF3108 domain-containing protein [Pyrinomonadaceae bacterium]
MKKFWVHPSQRRSFFKLLLLLPALSALIYPLASFVVSAHAQTTLVETNGFRVGERLTYSVSIGRITNAAFAELHTVSRGRIGDKDAIELRAKFKTLDLASATLYLVDENRMTFASPLTGLPLHTTITQNAFGLPQEKTQSFLAAPTPHADLLTMIYKIRQAGGSGSLTLQDNDRVYPVTFQAGVVEKHKTDAGEFETNLVSVQSEYFIDHGISDVRVNISTDDARLPVLVRFQTAKGHIKASLASVQMIEPEVEVVPTPTPLRTPVPERTPRPVVTPTPYIENLPLPAELAFAIGEKLDYRVLSGGQQVATLRLAARERKQFEGVDTLVLEAMFSNARAGAPFVSGDFVRAYVDPDTLAPRRVEMRFAGSLSAFTGTVKFDKQGSVITVTGKTPVDAPVGTHSILSLIYAARSFNLKPSRDLNNPINDTRVAVFWEAAPYVFTMRPSAPDLITIDGTKVVAQMVTVTTKNPTLDSLNIRVWLGNDDARLPLRFMVGQYQVDLITKTTSTVR